MGMNVIEVRNLWKVYRLYDSPQGRLWDLLGRGGKHREFHALREVSFEVPKGQTLGIIGQNGSGKSTLLKLLCGVLAPTTGAAKVQGRLAALLELGAGFNPELTGRENVENQGALMGFSREEMGARFQQIEDFAGIGAYIDQPVKTYSSGMYVRLAFSVNVHVDPDILVVDEALSVGDVLFQAKCFAKFQEFKEKGVTILFVTHGLSLVTAHCDRAILLDQGRLIEDGHPKVVVDAFNRLLTTKGSMAHLSAPEAMAGGQTGYLSGLQWEGMFQVNPDENRYGSRKAEVLEAGVFDMAGKPVQILARNEEYQVKVKVKHSEAMPGAIVGFALKDPKGTVLCGTNTWYQEAQLGDYQAGEAVVVKFRFRNRLNPGQYLLNVGAAAFEEGEYVVYDRRYDYLALQVTAEQRREGLFDTEPFVEWERLN
jgi:teichoic acid transport system ATP-binding protein